MIVYVSCFFYRYANPRDRNVPPHSFPPARSAALQARLSARVPLRAPHVTADARIEALSYQGRKLRHAQLNADVDPRGQIDVDLELRDADAGVAIPKATLAIHGPVNDHDIRLDVSSAPGDIALAAHGDRKSTRLNSSH